MKPMTTEKRKKTWLKIISVLMSVLLWFYVVNQGNTTKGNNLIETELQYYNVPQNLTVSGPDTVTVRVWGAFQETGEVTAYVDLSGLDKGVHEVPVNVRPVKGAMFTSVQPNRVEVSLKDLQENVLPVKYQIRQNPPEGYQVEEISMEPKNCLIKGEQSVLARVATVVASLDLTEVKDIATFKVKLEPMDKEGKVISKGIKVVPAVVEVSAVVDKPKTVKKLPVKSRLLGKVAEGYRLVEVISDPVQAAIIGEKSKVEGLSEISTVPVDISDKKESFSQAAQLEKPEGFTVYPAQVIINIKIEKNHDKEGQQ